MLDVLYGEADPAAARAFESHRRQCAPCGDELRALRGLRRDLGAWTVPARPSAAGAAVRRARAWLPLAAGLVLGVAGAVAMAAGTQGRADTVAAAMRSQDLRHRAEMDALKAALAADRPRAEATLEDVRRLIRESEARQAAVLDASLRGLAERSDAQRREDMAQVSAAFSYLEGRTGLQVARTTELMGHVLSASQKK
jgi:hypothetical protein